MHLRPPRNKPPSAWEQHGKHTKYVVGRCKVIVGLTQARRASFEYLSNVCLSTPIVSLRTTGFSIRGTAWTDALMAPGTLLTSICAEGIIPGTFRIRMRVLPRWRGNQGYLPYLSGTCLNITRKEEEEESLEDSTGSRTPRSTATKGGLGSTEPLPNFLNTGVQGILPPPLACAPSGMHRQFLMSPKDVGA